MIRGRCGVEGGLADGRLVRTGLRRREGADTGHRAAGDPEEEGNSKAKGADADTRPGSGG